MYVDPDAQHEQSQAANQRDQAKCVALTCRGSHLSALEPEHGECHRWYGETKREFGI